VGLTITGVAARTGVSVPTLRAWEQRFGFPRPDRLPSGHRRYGDDEVARIQAVVRERAAGRSLEAAIELARRPSPDTVDPERDATIFAALRRRHPELPVRVIGRAAMLALSLAIEEEIAALGDRPHLVVAFQRAELYRQARDDRWRGIARRAESTIVLADFARSRVAADGVLEVAIPPGAPAEREWALVCEGRRSAAVLAGWERADGRFEALWSVEPDITSDAGVLARALVAHWAPKLAPSPVPPVADVDDALRRGMAVTGRAIARLGDR
jgi:DNA-binding transcriptional MerR regulator